VSAGAAAALAVGVGLAALIPDEALAALLSPPAFSAAPPHPLKMSAAARMSSFSSLYLFMFFFESPYL
jgi:hypothetical protein